MVEPSEVVVHSVTKVPSMVVVQVWEVTVVQNEVDVDGMVIVTPSVVAVLSVTVEVAPVRSVVVVVHSSTVTPEIVEVQTPG